MGRRVVSGIRLEETKSQLEVGKIEKGALRARITELEGKNATLEDEMAKLMGGVAAVKIEQNGQHVAQPAAVKDGKVASTNCRTPGNYT